MALLDTVQSLLLSGFASNNEITRAKIHEQLRIVVLIVRLLTTLDAYLCRPTTVALLKPCSLNVIARSYTSYLVPRTCELELNDALHYTAAPTIHILQCRLELFHSQYKLFRQ